MIYARPCTGKGDKTGCSGATRALVPEHNTKDASEWYCEKCHISYPMSSQQIKQIKAGQLQPGLAPNPQQ